MVGKIQYLVDGRFVCSDRGIQIVLQIAEPQQRRLPKPFGSDDGQAWGFLSCQLCSLTKANNQNDSSLTQLIFLLCFSLSPPRQLQKDNSNLQGPYDSFPSYSGNFGNVFHRPNNDWTDLVLQPYPFSPHYTQGMSYIIRSLEPDQQYEAKVIAR